MNDDGFGFVVYLVFGIAVLKIVRLMYHHFRGNEFEGLEFSWRRVLSLGLAALGMLIIMIGRNP
ncbi:MAG: hypothetical protein RQ745_14190 [Longimicrobiales bacterium]|nr:hypothetical protein [Longimicrobiales bacterium]